MSYRAEIDGLRSLAVIPVILFHAGFTLFSGGYVGVDVFFVISGYLITGILLREIANGHFSIWRFYERRARRILPALLLVMLVTYPFAAAWMTAPQFADFTASLLATLGFVSNILFWQQSSYFDVAAELRPMLHTWSLSIEEQYYILFPPFLWAVYRYLGFRGAALTLLIIAVLSLGLAEIFVRDRPVATFYLLPFRAWELLAGALCAFVHYQGERKPNSILGLIGLVLILVSVFIFDQSTPFPSLFALVPVAGTVLVLLFAGHAGPVGRTMANPVVVGLGLISYSAYLWHQPIFALARIRFDIHPGDLVFLPLIAVTLCLAWASWALVEKPFRREMALRPFLWAMGGGATLVSLIGLLGVVEYQLGYSRTKPIFYSVALINTDVQREQTWTSVLQNPEFKEELRDFPNDSDLNVLIVGDSHAKDLFNALHTIQDQTGIAARRTTMGGACTDRIGARFEGTTPQQCFDQLVGRAGPLLENADIVILTKRWVIEDTFDAYLPVFIEGIEAMGKPTAIGSNTVEYSPEPPILLRQLHRQDELTADATATALFRHQRSDVASTNAHLRQIAEQQNVPFMDKSDLLCSQADNTCDALTPDGQAVYVDYGHYSLAGAAWVGDAIIEQGWLDPLVDRLSQNQSP